LAVDEEALRLFCRVNAAYNVWPYWREFIHQSLVRLELPPMTAQLLRVDDLLRAYSPENGATAPTGTPGSG
jgi:hypothetical protein